jgi:serine/threonine protein kinase
MTSSRWQAVSQSQFAWEREALDWLRNHLPDREPWHAWTNFEFIDEEGKVNEVDALMLTPAGLFLVEIKSRPGTVSGDAHTWLWVTDGRERAYDNPLILANRKSKRLASLLRRQSSVFKAKVRLPFVEPLIFLSATSLNCKLTGTARSGTYLRGQPGSETDPGIIGALQNGTGSVRDIEPSRVDQQHARVLARAMAEAGIRPSNKHRKVGDYQLGALLSEGASYQDWEGTHTAMDTVRRRVRIYTVSTAATAEARKSLVRQAQREFQLLEGIDHPGIVKVKEYHDSELGPALTFDHEPKSIRLDFLLREMGQLLSVDQRLQIVRDLAETLKYAHQKKLYHRALCPQSVLVQDVAGATPRPRIMNWQTGTREGTQSSDTIDPARRTVGGTMHVEEYVEDPGLVYLAPETSQAEAQHGPSLDVFSLGAITYHVFSGRPPAGSVLELAEKLRIGQGLRLSDVLDGCGKQLQDLIQYSTNPDVMGRYGNVDEFLQDLDKVVDELTTPEPEATVDPAEAKPEERLEGGFTVIRKMGRGSSADVLLVRPDGGAEEMVLKVALDASLNDRIAAEGEALSKLRHPNIVEWQRTLTVNGRTALLMRKAGDTTLSHRIREEARLSLDLLQRFGEELIQAVDYLEQQGVAHRDIKPDNIGMSQAGTRGKLQLVLFDFSLTRTSAENISAGTHPYLDPFLSLRKPPRWDLQAERFALGVTLHEMVTSVLPRWGDGKTQASMLDCEATLATERFDPLLRDGFTAFFARALNRIPLKRFDNAEDMLRDWRRVFEAGASTAHPASDPFEAVARLATANTNMAELGYSVEAQNVLEAMAIHNARELLAVDRVRFRYLRGVGDRIRKEIRLKAKALAAIRPDLVQGRPTLHEADDDTASAGATSVNELAAQLLPRRPAGDDRPEEAALAIYLGLEEADGSTLWTPLGVAATALSIDRNEVSGALLKARERWLKTPQLTELRNHFESLLSTQGGVMRTGIGTAGRAGLRFPGRRRTHAPGHRRRSRLLRGRSPPGAPALPGIRPPPLAADRPVCRTGRIRAQAGQLSRCLRAGRTAAHATARPRNAGVCARPGCQPGPVGTTPASGGHRLVTARGTVQPARDLPTRYGRLPGAAAIAGCADGCTLPQAERRAGPCGRSLPRGTAPAATAAAGLAAGRRRRAAGLARRRTHRPGIRAFHAGSRPLRRDHHPILPCQHGHGPRPAGAGCRLRRSVRAGHRGAEARRPAGLRAQGRRLFGADRRAPHGAPRRSRVAAPLRPPALELRHADDQGAAPASRCAESQLERGADGRWRGTHKRRLGPPDAPGAQGRASSETGPARSHGAGAVGQRRADRALRPDAARR